MIVGGIYSFNKGREVVEANYAAELAEVQQVLKFINSSVFKLKISKEKTMLGRALYDPGALNQAFKQSFGVLGWQSHRVKCDYSTDFYTPDYQPARSVKGAFREMDYVKNGLGVEVQFGKYAFMVYNVCAKMTIFHNLGLIQAGIEIVPLKEFADDMSSGVSYFEQFVWDLQQRGVADIDIPVLILGITADPPNEDEGEV